MTTFAEGADIVSACSGQGPVSAPSLDQMPDEIYLRIFGYMPTIDKLNGLLVTKRWHYIMKDHRLWGRFSTEGCSFTSEADAARLWQRATEYTQSRSRCDRITHVEMMPCMPQIPPATMQYYCCESDIAYYLLGRNGSHITTLIYHLNAAPLNLAMRFLVALESLTIVGKAAYGSFSNCCSLGNYRQFETLRLPASLRKLSIEVPELIVRECPCYIWTWDICGPSCLRKWDICGAVEELRFDGGPDSRNFLRSADLMPFIGTLKTLNIANARLEVPGFDESLIEWKDILEVPQLHVLIMRNVAVQRNSPLLKVLNREGIRVCRDLDGGDEVLEGRMSGRRDS